MGGDHVYVKDTQDAAQPLVLHGLFHGNLPFLVESKPAFHTESNAFSNSAFLTGSKPAFYTESSASKPLLVPTQNQMLLPKWHHLLVY